MITSQYRARICIYFVLVSFLFTSCTSGAQQTRQAILGQAQAIALVGDQTLQQAAPALAAIQAVITKTPGAYMAFDDVSQIALFITQGGAAPGGGYYTFVGAVDVNYTALLNANEVLADYGIDLQQFKSLTDLKMVLRYKGFVELSPTTLPMLTYALRLGLGYLRSIGSTISDVLILPVNLISPDTMPWCVDGRNCQYLTDVD